MDDKANTFVQLGYQMFFVDLKMLPDRRQQIKIFGKGLEGDILNCSKEHQKDYALPFLRNFKQADAFISQKRFKESVKKKAQIAGTKLAAEFSLKKVDHETKSLADKLYEGLKIMENESDPEFMVELENRPFGSGRSIKVTIKRLGVNPAMPVVNSLLKVIQQTEEMGMNGIIRPCSILTNLAYKKYYPTNTICINMEDVFLFLIPPKNSDALVLLHIPEMSVMMVNEHRDKNQVVHQELPHFFEPHEYTQDDTFKRVMSSPEQKMPVYQMSVGINNMYMETMGNHQVNEFLVSRIRRESDQRYSRNLMQPFFLAYQVRSYTFSDAVSEKLVSRGVANIGQINLLLNTWFLQYMSAWKTEFSQDHLYKLPILGSLEGQLRTVIEKLRPVAKYEKTKTRLHSLDVISKGVKVVDIHI